MKEKLKSFLKEIETTMACIAYAEAGEACPLNPELQETRKSARCGMSLQDAMACSAFAEAGVPCPVCEAA